MESFEREHPHTPQNTTSFGAVPPPPAEPPYARFPVASGRPPRRRMRRPAALLTTVAVAAAVIGGGTAYSMEQLLGGDGGSSGSVLTASGTNATAKGNVSQVVESVQDSVVEIKATSGSEQATGSGVVITKDGQIVTNNHVVSGADTVKVTFSSGKTAQAQVVGTDADKDLALLKVNGQNDLQPATLGDSDAVGVGDQVVAIGSPEGLSGTVTSGIVSAKNREVKVPKEDGDHNELQGGQSDGDGGLPFEYGGGQYNGGVQGETTTYKAIQTDASLNPGNSGGPLFNMSGQVIGINSAIFSAGSGDGQASQASAGSVGLGFAIPVNDVKQDLGSLRDGGA
ncbi:S1C family serine protease [Streptomyces sp. 8N114]|uniref:S1C family serine protease n=1 Tax=Streptomyces sp. 8N114 TaxID=3457419 RepID=UPI003FD68032